MSDLINGVEHPILDQEKGTALDFVTGELLFADIPGIGKDTGLMYDYRQPTIAQLREMLERDGRGRSLEQCLVMPIAGAEWRLEGEDKGPEEWVEAKLRADILDGGMETPMADVIAQKAEALIFRVAFHEKVWTAVDDDTKIAYKKIAWRPPDSCTLLRDRKTGDLRGFAQWKLGQPEQEPILLPYADVYVHGARRDPLRGICDLTVTYHNYRIKEKLKFLWYTYCEVLSLPRQIVLSNSPEEGKKAANAIAGLKNAGVAGIPASWVKEIKEISVGGQGATEFMDAIQYLDSDSALSLLAGFSELPARAMGSGSSHGPLGSYALAESAQNFFVDMLNSYALELNAQITNSLVADLIRWNFGKKVKVPKFKLDLEQQALAKAFDLLGRLLAAPAPVNVPAAFVKELVIAVAKQLNMDVNAVTRAIDQQTKQNEQAAQSAQQAASAPLSGAADVGTAVASQAQAQMHGAGSTS